MQHSRESWNYKEIIIILYVITPTCVCTCTRAANVALQCYSTPYIPGDYCMEYRHIVMTLSLHDIPFPCSITIVVMYVSLLQYCSLLFGCHKFNPDFSLQMKNKLSRMHHIVYLDLPLCSIPGFSVICRKPSFNFQCANLRSSTNCLLINVMTKELMQKKLTIPCLNSGPLALKAKVLSKSLIFLDIS